jgi:hypothetical protein
VVARASAGLKVPFIVAAGVFIIFISSRRFRGAESYEQGKEELWGLLSSNARSTGKEVIHD